jgi:nicotinamidase-related amidase
MAELELDAATTALVTIDLQRGIVGMTTVPHTATDVVTRAAKLAKRFREKKALVVLVRVDPGPTGELFPRPLTDIERPRMNPDAGWTDIVPQLGPEPGDALVTKHQPGAFYGTDIEVHLRRRGIQTIVICGIATNIGVEATARVAFEHRYNLVFVEDAMAARDAEAHSASVSKFFPTIGRVRTTEEVLAAFG